MTGSRPPNLNKFSFYCEGYEQFWAFKGGCNVEDNFKLFEVFEQKLRAKANGSNRVAYFDGNHIVYSPFDFGLAVSLAVIFKFKHINILAKAWPGNGDQSLLPRKSKGAIELDSRRLREGREIRTSFCRQVQIYEKTRKRIWSNGFPLRRTAR